MEAVFKAIQCIILLGLLHAFIPLGIYIARCLKKHSMAHSQFSSVQLLSRVRLCNPMDYSTPGLLVHHQLLELTQTHVH